MPKFAHTLERQRQVEARVLLACPVQFSRSHFASVFLAAENFEGDCALFLAALPQRRVAVVIDDHLVADDAGAVHQELRV
jgi:hypothetical protein